MADIRWRDSTIYRRGERGTIEPKTWRRDHRGLSIVVTRLFGCDGWFVQCAVLQLDRQLDADDAFDAGDFYADLEDGDHG